ncbi:hypothetical protein ES703_69055 [subsurface metagenome]
MNGRVNPEYPKQDNNRCNKKIGMEIFPSMANQEPMFKGSKSEASRHEVLQSIKNACPS